MQKILSYPRYFPEIRDLRAYLLLYDSVHTIVPWNDQGRVLGRDEIGTLQDHLDAPIGFYDPTAYYVDWLDDFGVDDSFQALKDAAAGTPNFDAATKAVRNWHQPTITPDDDLFADLRAANWHYLSYQKMPPLLSESLFEAGLAVPVSETELTEQPLLMPRRLGDMILSRLARQISAADRIPPVASRLIDAGDFLVDARMTDHEQRTELLAFALDVAIPDEIEDIPIGEFRDLRDSYADVRRELSETWQRFCVRENLDSIADTKALRDELDARRSDIAARIATAQKAVRRRGQTSTAIDIVFGATGGAVGALLGDVEGAIIGGAMGSVLGRLGKSLASWAHPQDAEAIEQIALITNAVQAKANAAKSRPPLYRV